jgi:hypothetical protein
VEQAGPHALPYDAHSALVVRVESTALHYLDRDLKRRGGLCSGSERAEDEALHLAPECPVACRELLRLR